MLKYSTGQSHISPIALSVNEDHILRRAFGRFAESRYRKEGEMIVSVHYEKDRCFHCDCCAEADAPLIFLVSGTYIRRQAEGKGTPHHESCEFAREPPEQKRLVNSYRRRSVENEHRLNLVRNFRDEESVPPSPRTYSVTTNRSRPSLARVLCSLLHEAKLDRFDATESLRGGRAKQVARLEAEAVSYNLTRDHNLSSWLATSLRGYLDLKKKLEEGFKGSDRPHGLFIETFHRIENNMLYPKLSYLKPIPITGKLTVFGEGDVMRRPPYLVIGLLTRPSANVEAVELIRAYAHPCVAWDRLTLVDSQLERETLRHLIACRDKLHKESGITMTIEKPLYDVGPIETADSREVCVPDFILTCEGEGVINRTVVIETMGYDDPVYRARKQRMHQLFKHIRSEADPVPVIEHDRFKPNMKPDEVDFQFCEDVCRIIKGNWR